MLRSRRLKIGLTLFLFAGGLLGMHLRFAYSQIRDDSGIVARPGGGPTARVSGSAMMGPGPMGMAPPGGTGMPGQTMTESQLAELQLSQQARELLRNYSSETNAKSKQEIKTALREILIGQFDLQHQRRDEELRRIEKRLADLRTKLTKRADAKDTIVNRRLEQLVSDVEGLGWGADDVPQDLFDSGFGSPAMFPPTSMMPGMSGAPGSSGLSGTGSMPPGMGSPSMKSVAPKLTSPRVPPRNLTPTLEQDTFVPPNLSPPKTQPSTSIPAGGLTPSAVKGGPEPTPTAGPGPSIEDSEFRPPEIADELSAPAASNSESTPPTKSEPITPPAIEPTTPESAPST